MAPGHAGSGTAHDLDGLGKVTEVVHRRMQDHQTFAARNKIDQDLARRPLGKGHVLAVVEDDGVVGRQVLGGENGVVATDVGAPGLGFFPERDQRGLGDADRMMDEFLAAN